MWPKIFSRLTAQPDQTERLIQELHEQNVLMRTLLNANGIAIPKTPALPSASNRRRLTAKDVRIVTRQDVLEEQIKERASADQQTARDSSPTASASSDPQKSEESGSMPSKASAPSPTPLNSSDEQPF